MIGVTSKTGLRRAGQALLAVAGLALLGGCERWALDRQMEELCKKDGGIKVYETVTLPASDFSQWGEPMGRYIHTAKSEEDRLGPDYRYVTERKFIVGNLQTRADHGEGTLVRWHFSVYRRADNKLLGEEVRYHRGGGDGFTFGFQPSGQSCPVLKTALDLQVFIREK